MSQRTLVLLTGLELLLFAQLQITLEPAGGELARRRCGTNGAAGLMLMSAVAKAAVVNVNVLRRILGFYFDAVRTAVGEREIGDGNFFATCDVKNVVPIVPAVPTFSAQNDFRRIAAGAADGDVGLLI